MALCTTIGTRQRILWYLGYGQLKCDFLIETNHILTNEIAITLKISLLNLNFQINLITKDAISNHNLTDT